MQNQNIEQGGSLFSLIIQTDFGLLVLGLVIKYLFFLSPAINNEEIPQMLPPIMIIKYLLS